MAGAGQIGDCSHRIIPCSHPVNNSTEMTAGVEYPWSRILDKARTGWPEGNRTSQIVALGGWIKDVWQCMQTAAAGTKQRSSRRGGGPPQLTPRGSAQRSYHAECWTDPRSNLKCLTRCVCPLYHTGEHHRIVGLGWEKNNDKFEGVQLTAER